jgi:hypothetical protein
MPQFWWGLCRKNIGIGVKLNLDCEGKGPKVYTLGTYFLTNSHTCSYLVDYVVRLINVLKINFTRLQVMFYGCINFSVSEVLRCCLMFLQVLHFFFLVNLNGRLAYLFKCGWVLSCFMCWVIIKSCKWEILCFKDLQIYTYTNVYITLYRMLRLCFSGFWPCSGTAYIS